MPIELPTFKGYTVDERLREFRKVKCTESRWSSCRLRVRRAESC